MNAYLWSVCIEASYRVSKATVTVFTGFVKREATLTMTEIDSVNTALVAQDCSPLLMTLVHCACCANVDG